MAKLRTSMSQHAPSPSIDSSSGSPRIGALRASTASGQGSRMDHPDRLADKAATGQALPSNRLQDKYAAVKAQLKQKDTSSDEEEAEDSRAFTHSNPFALVYDSNNTSCDAASATSELDVTEEPQDVGGEEFPSDPTSAEVQAELAHLNAVVKLEQLMQWACANDDNIAGSAAQAALAGAVQGHAAAPTLQEVQSAALLVSHHALRQLEQWAAPGQQALDHLAASSSGTAPQMAEADEVAQEVDGGLLTDVCEEAVEGLEEFLFVRRRLCALEDPSTEADGWSSAEVEAQLAWLTVQVRLEQVMQWAVACGESSIHASGQAMTAEDVQGHAAAPTFQEAQCAAALAGNHALRQLEWWAAAVSSNTAAEMEAQEVAEVVPDRCAHTVLEHEVEGLEEYLWVQQRLRPQEGPATSQALPADASEVTPDTTQANSHLPTAVASASLAPDAAIGLVASPAVQQSVPASIVQQSGPASIVQQSGPASIVQQSGPASTSVDEAEAPAPAADAQSLAPVSCISHAAASESPLVDETAWVSKGDLVAVVGDGQAGADMSANAQASRSGAIGPAGESGGLFYGIYYAAGAIYGSYLGLKQGLQRH